MKRFMQSTIKERLFWWGAVPALVAVLLAVGILQYRWSNEVSAATRSQMESNLQSSLKGFRADFTSELGAVCIDLRSAIDDSGQVEPARIVDRFHHWQETAAHPAVVSQIYLWRPSRRSQLLRLNQSRDKMEQAQWPEDWAPLRLRLEEMHLVTAGGERRLSRLHSVRGRLHERHPPETFFPWFVDQSIPALIYPPRPRASYSGKQNEVNLTWIIVPLNANVLERDIFPELRQRYFHGPDGVDYRVAVVQGANGHVLYASDSEFAGNSDLTRDGALNLFGSPFRRGPVAPGQKAIAHMWFQNTPRLPALDDKRVVGVDRFVRLEPLLYPDEDNGWQVVVQHQRGSLAAAVSNLRWRHLLLSFSVLVLLAVTMALVVIASQRARRLAALQMNFVAGVSHELRTPLAVISSAAENLAHGVVSDQAQLARYGASIQKQARQLTHLVEQVLVFAATQQKRDAYRLRPVNVGEAIDAALESTASMAAGAGIAVERRVEPGLPSVAADFAPLSQCLQNLITNAIKYGGESRWLGISARPVKENGFTREVAITVRDRGIGIAAEEMKHIFEPFYRSPAVTGSNVHGTGLGLPLVRTVIEAMRGSLTVSSQPGKGSTFTIYLDVAGESPAAEAAADTIPSETAGYYP